MLHKLEVEDYAPRAAVCHDLLHPVDEENLMNPFCSATKRHIWGIVNIHNCRIWAEEQPNVFSEWQLDSTKISVWLGLMKDKIYSPFLFAEKIVTGTNYLDMLQLFLEAQQQQDSILASVICQQDGASPHYANTVQGYLNDTFPNRWIGRAADHMWAPALSTSRPLTFLHGVSSRA